MESGLSLVGGEFCWYSHEGEDHSLAARLTVEVIMSLEALNTFGTLATVVIVSATAIAALIQLRHLRAANQINAMLAVGEALDAKAVRDASDLVRANLSSAINDLDYRKLVVARVRGTMPPDVKAEYADLAAAARFVCNSYEELGNLIKRGFVDPEYVFDRYCVVVLRSWKELELQIGLVREVLNDSSVWENFEYLAVQCEDWQRRHPSSYPRGVRRMQIDLPWPVPTAQAT